MDHSTFLITVYCLIDDWYGTRRLRQRGPAPKLHDVEVLTIELVGEWWGLETESAIYAHFCTFWRDYFPTLPQVDRTTFTRQVAKLWALKRELWAALGAQVAYDPQLGLIDSMPLPLCKPTRVARLRQLKEWGAWGYDSAQKQTYFGLRLHLRVQWPGVIVAFCVAPADASDLAGSEELLPGPPGWVLADRAYWSPQRFADWQQRAIALLAPYRTRRHEPFTYPANLIQLRRHIETVFSQLTERWHAKRTRARTQLTLTARWMRKIVAHTLGVWFTQQLGLPPLRFSRILTYK